MLDNYRDVIATQRNLEFFTVAYRFLIQVRIYDRRFFVCVCVCVCVCVFCVACLDGWGPFLPPHSGAYVHRAAANALCSMLFRLSDAHVHFRPIHDMQVIPGLVVAPLYFAGKVHTYTTKTHTHTCTHPHNPAHHP